MPIRIYGLVELYCKNFSKYIKNTISFLINDHLNESKRNLKDHFCEITFRSIKKKIAIFKGNQSGTVGIFLVTVI
jgi:hypothetical protein